MITVNVVCQFKTVPIISNNLEFSLSKVVEFPIMPTVGSSVILNDLWEYFDSEFEYKSKVESINIWEGDEYPRIHINAYVSGPELKDYLLKKGWK